MVRPAGAWSAGNKKARCTMIADRRTELLARISRALYRWSTARENATWDGKRHGLKCPSTSGVRWKSCGAFREWAIFCHDGLVCFCMDGFAFRDRNCRSGSVGVLIGTGEYEFPWDDSRTYHSLRMTASGGAEIAWVTCAPEVAWEARIEAMSESLEKALAELEENIRVYDEQVQDRLRAEQAAKINAAAAAIA